ncbi:MAG: hypothetical protein P4L84_13210 [Isosphaeraceae bacterium]|nr:hypothetical protein [Isosphaeraceae bacterium]
MPTACPMIVDATVRPPTDREPGCVRAAFVCGEDYQFRSRTAYMRLLVLCLGLSVLEAGARGADNASAAENDEMRRHAAQVEINALSQGQRRPLERVAEPLMRYSDPARGAAKGALWAWGTVGRPAAIVEMEINPSRPRSSQWVHGVVSLSPELIAASWTDGRQWKASRPGLLARPVPDAPAPAASKPDRLRQMKDLARRFGVREDAGTVRGKIQLRLLPTPIHRYEDPRSGLQDGAIFVFATGTNPETLLVLESRSERSGPGAWCYGLARVSGCALTAELDGREVWSQEEANPPHDGAAYMNRHHAVLDGPE